MSYTQPNVYELISKQTNDPIVERKTCRVSGSKFAIYQSDLEFYNKISPTFAWKKVQIPTPTLCPEERRRLRLMFRNENKLYKRICTATNQPIISMYNEQYTGPVYTQKYRRSDAWDALDYGIAYTPAQSIFEHLRLLLFRVPRIAIKNDDGLTSENCAYCNDFLYGKNCYFAFETGECENNLFVRHSNNSKDCVDCLEVNAWSAVCYECINCAGLYNCSYLQESEACTNCLFGYDMKWCTDCLLSVGQVNKQYLIWNTQYTKESYATKKAELLAQSPESLIQQFTDFVETYPHRQRNIMQSQESYGNNLYDCQRVRNSYGTMHSKDCKYVYSGYYLNNCQDVQCWKSELCYEGQTPDQCFQCHFCARVQESQRLLYCDNCISCQDCFGCVGLKNKQYCIFNKQYTKDEYEKTVAQILEQMMAEWTRGAFFDPSLSPFGYNETVAMDYFPLKEDEAAARWYHRSAYEYHLNIPAGAPVIHPQDYTADQRHNLQEDDSIVNKIILCEHSGKPFRIIGQELEFYRKHDLPLPRKHPDLRHAERLAKRPPRVLYLRTCDKTAEQIVSVYPPESPCKVYSTAAYENQIST